jgi:nitrite reductase (NADH) small subunit
MEIKMQSHLLIRIKTQFMNCHITESITWFHACKKNDVPENGGVCVKYKENQIALFYFKRRDEWFATQNLCPHRRQMALSRGIIGSLNGEPKVACPFHKKTFSLVDGRCMNEEDDCRIETYLVKVENDDIYIGFADEKIHEEEIFL